MDIAAVEDFVLGDERVRIALCSFESEFIDDNLIVEYRC